MEKVTLHQTGMKIAIRNEFASSKSSMSDSTKNDQPLKITLSNPDAVKVGLCFHRYLPDLSCTFA